MDRQKFYPLLLIILVHLTDKSIVIGSDEHTLGASLSHCSQNRNQSADRMGDVGQNGMQCSGLAQQKIWTPLDIANNLFPTGLYIIFPRKQALCTVLIPEMGFKLALP